VASGLAGLALCLAPSNAQTSVPAAANRRAVINFAGAIDNAKFEDLKYTIDSQIARGVRKFTLLISSAGGDMRAAANAYNYLRTVPAEITTFSIGNVYSSALLLYCAGYRRYSLPGPDVRFLIQPTSANDAIVQAVSYLAPSKMPELQDAIKVQRILLPEQAKAWGIVQEIRHEFMEPGATFLAIDTPLPLIPFVTLVNTPQPAR
jgi:ATP-dependent protease ClpP protease subunit